MYYTPEMCCFNHEQRTQYAINIDHSIASYFPLELLLLAVGVAWITNKNVQHVVLYTTKIMRRPGYGYGLLWKIIIKNKGKVEQMITICNCMNNLP